MTGENDNAEITILSKFYIFEDKYVIILTEIKILIQISGKKLKYN